MSAYDEDLDHILNVHKQMSDQKDEPGLIGRTLAPIASAIPEGMKGIYRQTRALGDYAGIPSLSQASTDSIKDVEGFQNEHPTFKTPEDMGILGRTIHGGATGFVSLAPSMLAGPAAPLAMGVQSGLESSDTAKERALAAGKTPGEAQDIANQEGLASGLLTAGTMGALHYAKPLIGGATGVAKDMEQSVAGAEGPVSTLVKSPTAGQYAKDIAATTGAFGTQGAVGAGVNAEIEKEHGIGDKGFGQAALEAAPESLLSGALFGGMDALQLNKRISNLEKLHPNSLSPEAKSNLEAYKAEKAKREAPAEEETPIKPEEPLAPIPVDNEELKVSPVDETVKPDDGLKVTPMEEPETPKENGETENIKKWKDDLREKGYTEEQIAHEEAQWRQPDTAAEETPDEAAYKKEVADILAELFQGKKDKLSTEEADKVAPELDKIPEKEAEVGKDIEENCMNQTGRFS